MSQFLTHNSVIPAPKVHAWCLEWMEKKLKPGARVLDIGAGSGFMTAAMYEMVKRPPHNSTVPQGKVIGIEHIEELARKAMGNLVHNYKKELEQENIEVIVGDGRAGYE